ncbi:hypothetical protein G3446_10255 [Thiorhodococcus minor]|uniref:Peptidase M41 domain-containing protein n=2 Tax=Thiorhodococcus minor TaxID=57489 RepID=A0A6M0JXJ1_9GAMM|nr:hypothetical protein [Thiorhodococcus minor]
MNAIDRHMMSPADRARLTAEAEDLVTAALEAQGLAALECTRLHAAYHEAGHCIAHHHHGDRLRAVRVFERAGRWLGHTRAGKRWALTPDSPPTADMAQAQRYLAGPLAELLFSGSPALAAGVDEIALARGIVATVAIKIGVDAAELMDLLIVQTIALLEHHRRALDAIARRLMRKPKLEGDVVTAIIRSACAAPAEVARR